MAYVPCHERMPPCTHPPIWGSTLRRCCCCWHGRAARGVRADGDSGRQGRDRHRRLHLQRRLRRRAGEAPRTTQPRTSPSLRACPCTAHPHLCIAARRHAPPLLQPFRRFPFRPLLTLPTLLALPAHSLPGHVPLASARLQGSSVYVAGPHHLLFSLSLTNLASLGYATDFTRVDGIPVGGAQAGGRAGQAQRTVAGAGWAGSGTPLATGAARPRGLRSTAPLRHWEGATLARCMD